MVVVDVFGVRPGLGLDLVLGVVDGLGLDLVLGLVFLEAIDLLFFGGDLFF